MQMNMKLMYDEALVFFVGIFHSTLKQCRSYIHAPQANLTFIHTHKHAPNKRVHSFRTHIHTHTAFLTLFRDIFCPAY